MAQGLGSALTAVLMVFAGLGPAWASTPRMSDDGNTLILLGEVRHPLERRQPEITLSQDPGGGSREIRVAGEAIRAPWAVQLSCGGRTRTVPLTSVSELPAVTVAAYAVAPAAAQTVLQAATCDLWLTGVRLPIPQAMLRVAWADESAVLAPAVRRAVRTLVGEVFSVVDSNTIVVRLGSHMETVRYIGVDAPEVPQHPRRGPERGGRLAAALNRALVADKIVRLELDVEERDDAGRLLAYVYVEDHMVNAEMIRRGYGRATTVPPNIRYRDTLLGLCQEAREHKRGIWGNLPAPAPTPRPAVSPAAEVVTARPVVAVQARAGVHPADAWSCPVTHPIKGNFTTHSGERCIHHLPSGSFYEKTKPERCYAREADARADGCRRSRR